MAIPFFQKLADDLAMGFGGKERTKDFEARTARTIARQDGFSDVGQSRRASDYMAQKGISQADLGNMAASTAPRYTSIRDRFDGGGMGMSGARFSRGDVSSFDKDGDNYISEQEYLAAEKNQKDLFETSTMRGIPSLSNRFVGARPLGSYAQERDLLQNTGVPGTNIGTSGPADYLMGGGFLGNMLRGGRPSTKQLANPLMARDARLTAEAVDAAVPVTTRQEGPLRVEGPGLSDKAEKTVQQYTNPILSYPKDQFGNVVLDPQDMLVNDFARGGIVSLVRR
tara:strand:- start:7409 stop:8254 length:846 start_codon:yes stop_codon:yes gene_type:complete